MYIKPRAILVDESIYWDENLEQPAGGIFGLYIYDSNVGIHCCELIPSYALYRIGVILGNENCPDKIKDEIDECWNEATERIIYMHCANVDMSATVKLETYRCKKDEYEKFMDELQESYGDNWPYIDEIDWEVDLTGYLTDKNMVISGFTKSHVVRKLGLDIEWDRIQKVA